MIIHFYMQLLFSSAICKLTFVGTCGVKMSLQVVVQWDVLSKRVVADMDEVEVS